MDPLHEKKVALAARQREDALLHRALKSKRFDNVVVTREDALELLRNGPFAEEMARARAQAAEAAEEEAYGPPVGCFGKWSCGMPGTGRRRRRSCTTTRREAVYASAADAAAAADATGIGSSGGGQQSKQQQQGGGVRRALFGEKKSASARLEEASALMNERAAAVAERATAARQKAVELSRAGRRAEALTQLRRAKQLEQQHAQLSTAALNIEMQSDSVGAAELQSEVATALSISTSKLKSKTKGLLGRTEAAVDRSAELADLHADVSNVLQELGARTSADFDDDELAAELGLMVGLEDELTTAAPAAAATAAPAEAAEAPAFPSAPTKVPARAPAREWAPSAGLAVAESSEAV